MSSVSTGLPHEERAHIQNHEHARHQHDVQIVAGHRPPRLAEGRHDEANVEQEVQAEHLSGEKRQVFLYIHMYIYIYIHMYETDTQIKPSIRRYMYKNVYIYIYRERERVELCVCACSRLPT